MIPNKKIKLLDIWENKIFDEFSISEIMKLSKKKTKTWVFNSLKILEKNKLLISKKKSNMNLYSLNLDNPLLIQTLQYLESQKMLNFSELDLIIDAIKNIKITNYCLIIFGSYAKKEQSNKSDIDICFLTENENMSNKIKPYFNEVKLNHSIRIDEHYITFDEFIQMLLRNEENLGKQIAKNHKLFYNADIYYNLLKEANKHGYR
jgi:predicted nucleotidyltransferase